MKILVIEDDQDTGEFILKSLRELSHTVDWATDGHQGLMLATESSYDVMIIDRMLPKLDGLTLLKTLRDSRIQTPTLFLSALGSLEERVQGLESGGDDYLIKPFAFSELYARICSLARRPQIEKVETLLKAKDLEMDVVKRIVTRDGESINLMPTEFKLLEYLLRKKGQVVTKTMLLEGVWDFHFDPKTNIVETHVSRLRSKVNLEQSDELIITVRGAGYRIDE